MQMSEYWKIFGCDQNQMSNEQKWFNSSQEIDTVDSQSNLNPSQFWHLDGRLDLYVTSILKTKCVGGNLKMFVTVLAIWTPASTISLHKHLKDAINI